MFHIVTGLLEDQSKSNKVLFEGLGFSFCWLLMFLVFVGNLSERVSDVLRSVDYGSY